MIERVEREMKVRFADDLPSEAIRVRGYRGIRLILFEYLGMHVGDPVSVPRLRALTGDQIHTERRLRELRDLGVRLEATRVSEENNYVLVSEEPDFDYAEKSLIGGMVKAVPGWTAARKRELIADITSR